MGLSGKLSAELEIKSSADEYFHGYLHHRSVFHKALPGGLHKSEIHEGDGKSLNSINQYFYVLEGDTVVTTKAKREALDEEKKFFTLNHFGGHVGENYNKYKLHMQVFTKDGKNFVKCIIEYEKLNEEIPEPINYLKVTTNFCKGLEAHLLQA